MNKILPLIRGQCPVCNKNIMNDKKTSYINGGMEFWVKFSDESRATFAICLDCLDKITQEQLSKIMERQKVNWGFEIQKQLLWYVENAINLKIVEHAKTKAELE